MGGQDSASGCHNKAHRALQWPDYFAGIQHEQRDGKFDVQSWRSISKLLVPPADKLYIPWCTFVVIVALCCIFFFMAGESKNPNAGGLYWLQR